MPLPNAQNFGSTLCLFPLPYQVGAPYHWQQQQHVGNSHLVDLNNHAFPLVAENWIILRTLLATTLPTFICGFAFFLVARRGVLINTSPPIKLPLSWQCQGKRISK